MKRPILFAAVSLGLTFLIMPRAQALADEFYQGKTIRFIVGFSAGGGYDSYTRTVARHIGKHIAGRPATVVENMAGAGSVLAANHMYNKVEPDGLTVGIWNSHNVFNDAMDDKSIRIDGRKVGWIGAPSKDTVVCAIMGFTGPKTFAEIQQSQKAVKMGATRSGNTVHLPMMLNKWAGTNFEIIPGYGGTSRIRLAMQSKEVDGACWSWQSMRTTARAMLDAESDDELIPFIIDKNWNEPEVKEIATFTEAIKDPDNLRAYKTWNAPNEFARPLSLPPGVPKQRLEVLRRAFVATMKDREFIADAEKSKLDLDYTPAAEIEEYVRDIYSIPPKVKENLQFLMRKSDRQS
jgi:tripartite-type tricarboxylate transporter receptor subunit TctC